MKKHGSMNHTFRLVWSDVQNAFVAVSEHVKGKGKKSNKSIAASSLMAVLGFTAAGALAGPELNQITAGEATVTVNGDVTDIHQNTEQLRADWNNFNIEANETVNFIQPGKTSLAVNNILDTNGTRIMGNLNANGQVWLINPNGVLFGQNAKVDVGSILASTLNPMDNITTDGKQVFGNGGTGSIINQGSINAEAGYVAFIGNKVSNQGGITANNGAVALGAGSQVTVEFAGSNLLSLTVDQSTLDNLAENKQLIQANGGMVLMSAGARDSLIASVVNNDGKIEAKTVQHKDGKIILMGGMAAGTTKVAGTLDASAETGDGGFIETSAANIQIADDLQVTTKADNGETGEWLIDPRDFNINANGGSNNNKIKVSTLQNNLANSDVTIKTTNTNGNGTGDINVNAAVTWNSANTLTLESRFGSGGINIDQNITFTNGGLKLDATGTITAAGAISGKTFDLKSGTWQQVGANLANFDVKDFRISGGTFIRAKGGDGTSAAPYQLTDVFGLQGVGSAGMLDKHYTLVNDIDASGTSTWNSNKGFDPLGDAQTRFTGKFDGSSHTVNDLTINRPSESFVGLFGYANGATIQNLGVVGGSVTGRFNVGGLVGVNKNDSTISNAYATGSVTGYRIVGGLVGINNTDSTINNAYATGSVTGNDLVGGLVGANNESTISNAYATGSVTSTGTGTGTGTGGGLVGYNLNSTINNAYATGSVTGDEDVGGLVGVNSDSTISNAYATGSVTGTNNVGGLVGRSLGGFIYYSFWNTDTSNQATSAGGTGKTTAEMQSLSTFTGASWDIDGEGGTGKTWRIYEGHTSPLLRSFMTTLDLSADQTVTYNGNAQTYALPAGTDSSKVSGNVASGTNAATYQNDLYSGQQGYDIKGHDSNLIIDKKAATVTANSDTVTYNGQQQSVTGFTVSGLVNGEGASVLDDVQLAGGEGKNAASYQHTVTTAVDNNYDLTTVDGQLIVNKADATVIANSDTVTYNGEQQSVTGFTVSGLVAGEDASVLDNVELRGGKGRNAGTYNHRVKTATDDNYNLTKQNGVLTIDKKAITVDAIAENKIYDGNKQATVELNGQGVIAGDNIAFEADATFKNKHAGSNKKVTANNISATGADAGNYSFNSTATDRADIAKRAVELSISAEDKTYDGNTDATLDTFTASNVIAGDKLTVSYTDAQFDDKNVGTDKDVTVSLETSGQDARNYVIAPEVEVQADITPKSINVSAIAADKTYDGKKKATIVDLISAGVVAGDNVSFDYDKAKFDNKNAGENKLVTVTGIAGSGDDVSNYSFGESTIAVADVDQKQISVDALVDNKVYDANRSANVGSLSSDGIIGNDDVTFSSTNAKFDTKHAGVDKTVTIFVAADGNDVGNYILVSNKVYALADITPKNVNVNALVEDKEYDGDRKAVVDALMSAGIIDGDEVVFAHTKARFDNKNVGENKQVTVKGISATGADAGNYAFGDEVYASADIYAKNITVDALAYDKTYDGNRQATADLSSQGIVAGDVVSFSGNARFKNKHAGDNKKVTVNNISATGNDAGNYSFNVQATDRATISKLGVDLTVVADNKVYDGNKTAMVSTLESAGILSGDQVSFSHSTAEFEDKNVGVDKTVSVEGISATGRDARNYAFIGSVEVEADITAKNITVDALAYDKTYDGNRQATADLSSQGIVAGDVVSFSGNARFKNKHAGDNKKVTVNNISATGNDAGNYSFNVQATDRATISKLGVDLTVVADNKVYDGNKTAMVSTLESAGILSGDQVSFSHSTAEFEDKNVGVDKTVSVEGISATGRDARNYAFIGSVEVEADITAKNITVDALAYDKTYDGNRQATADLSSQGIVAGDVVSFSGNARFKNKHAGDNKKVTVNNISATGNDAGNYSFNVQATDRATISKLGVDLTVVADNKVYDGNKTAMVSTLESAGILSGDQVSFSHSTAEFEDKNVGVDKTVSVEGISATGRDARNYAFIGSVEVEADITAKNITVDALAYDKTYDGNRQATADLSSQGIVAGDVVSFSGNARFKNKHAGDNKKVTVNNISATGNDAGNYSFNVQATDRATISKLGVDLTVVADNKVYDGNKTAMVSTLESAGILSGDQVSFSHSTAEFEDKNVGVDKTVSVEGISATGRDARNYAFIGSVEVEADITAKNITVDALAYDKTYDGNRQATADLSSQGIVAGDVVSFSGNARFKNKHAGDNKKVTVNNISATGNDAGNYSFNVQATDRATISKLGVDLTVVADNKVYDGNKTAMVSTLESAGILSGDQVSFSHSTAMFEDKNVGVDKKVSVEGISATGRDARNYAFIGSVEVEADITAKNITVDALAYDKIYDATRRAEADLSSQGLIQGDDVSFTGRARFNNKNVGLNKKVTVRNIRATGNDAGNYTFNQKATDRASITALAIDVEARAYDKTYDGNRHADADLFSNGILGNDKVWFDGVAKFGTKHARNNKTVTVRNITATGQDARNYVLIDNTATDKANITKLAIDVTATASDKVYDGNKTAMITALESAGIIAGDDMQFNVDAATGMFDHKNVGEDKTVYVNNITASGSDARNYVFLDNTTTTADVTPKHLHVRAFAEDKVYDATTDATFDFAWVDGFVPTDEAWMSFTRSTATFDNKNVGQGKTVTFTGMDTHGADAGNYTFDPVVTSTADITPKHLHVRAFAHDKVYDGNTDATFDFAWVDGFVPTDEAWMSFTRSTATFDNKNVGQGKTVTFTGMDTHGADAGNYTFDPVVTSSANVTPKHLHVRAFAHDKVYDGNTDATFDFAWVDGFVPTDEAWMSFTRSTATFDNKNVGQGKTVTFTGMDTHGADAGNYTFDPMVTSTAAITPQPVKAVKPAPAVADVTPAPAVKMVDQMSSTTAALLQSPAPVSAPVVIAEVGQPKANVFNPNVSALMQAATKVNGANVKGSATLTAGEDTQEVK